jgi:hypothetical protein
MNNQQPPSPKELEVIPEDRSLRSSSPVGPVGPTETPEGHNPPSTVANENEDNLYHDANQAHSLPQSQTDPIVRGALVPAGGPGDGVEGRDFASFAMPASVKKIKDDAQDIIAKARQGERSTERSSEDAQGATKTERHSDGVHINESEVSEDEMVPGPSTRPRLHVTTNSAADTTAEARQGGPVRQSSAVLQKKEDEDETPESPLGTRSEPVRNRSVSLSVQEIIANARRAGAPQKENEQRKHSAARASSEDPAQDRKDSQISNVSTFGGKEDVVADDLLALRSATSRRVDRTRKGKATCGSIDRRYEGKATCRRVGRRCKVKE